MKRIRDGLNHYFFAVSRYNTLGLLRIVLCYWIIKPYFSFAPLHYPTETNLHEGAFDPPLLSRVFFAPFPVTGEGLNWLHFALFIVSGLACLGLLTRITVFLTGFLYTYITSIGTSSGLFNHEASLTCQVLLFLAFAPGADSLSLDRLILWAYRSRRKGKEPFWPSIIGPPVPVWGTRFILILLAIVYFSAGLSKVRFTGWRWLDGQTLSYYVSEKPSVYRGADVQRFLGYEDTPESQRWKDGFGIRAHHYGNFQNGDRERKIGRFIARTPALMSGLSVITLVFELGAPLLLLGGWYRNIVLIGAIVLHQGIGLLMGLPFGHYKVVCFLMLDWELIINAISVRLPGFRKLTSFFAGDVVKTC